MCVEFIRLLSKCFSFINATNIGIGLPLAKPSLIASRHAWAAIAAASMGLGLFLSVRPFLSGAIAAAMIIPIITIITIAMAATA